MKIKNIFWDVDGVLANLNNAYYKFLTGHPNWRNKFDISCFSDLPKALPISSSEFGCLELLTHPEFAEQLNHDFITSEFFDDRPLYPDTKPAIIGLHDMGINQTIMSATGTPERKKAVLKSLFDGLPIDIRVAPHGEGKEAKESHMIKYMNENNWNSSETILVDDRPYNLRAAIRAGIRPIRYRSEFTIDNPIDLKTPEFFNLKDLVEYIKKKNGL